MRKFCSLVRDSNPHSPASQTPEKLAGQKVEQLNKKVDRTDEKKLATVRVMHFLRKRRLKMYMKTCMYVDCYQHLAACRMLFLVTVLYFMGHVPIHMANFLFEENALLRTLCDYLAYLSTWANFFIYYNTGSHTKTILSPKIYHRYHIW